jgi:hypothetical protein
LNPPVERRRRRDFYHCLSGPLGLALPANNKIQPQLAGMDQQLRSQGEK